MLCDLNLIDENNCEVDSEDQVSVDDLKKWVKKKIAQGFICYDLKYQRDDPNYNIIATLPQLVEVANILGILDEFDCSKVEENDIYLTSVGYTEDEDEDYDNNEDDEGEE